MKIAIIYTSMTGNTEDLVCLIRDIFLTKGGEVFLCRIERFPVLDLKQFDGIIVGTYTWGLGEIPSVMMDLYHAFETLDLKSVVTGVVGTGDSGYSNFCGAVDLFKNMLYVHTKLAVTLKVEILPQKEDFGRCERFVDIFLEQMNEVILK